MRLETRNLMILEADRGEDGSSEPVAVRLVDLDLPVGDLETDLTPDGATYAEAHLLVRLHGEPLGTVRLALRDGALERTAVAGQIRKRLGSAIEAHAARHRCLTSSAPDVLETGLPADGGGCPGNRLAGGEPPRVDVVVATAGRPGPLRSCLESLLELDYPRFGVVVVDNRPGEPATRAVVEAVREHDDRIHYVAESRPGSSVARNRGVAESSADVLAFTDDDVRVDPQWLSWLVEGFRGDPEVTVVTGLVMPTDMDTPAKRRFEERVGFSKGFVRRTFDLREHRASEVPLFPYWGATFGSGNSMAFRRAQLVELGGFDPALGVGSRARSGADIESFSHALLRGGRLVYEPRALCWHDHRSDESALQRQLFSYWVGFTAILTKWALRRPLGLGGAVLRALPAAVARGGGEKPVAREVERFRDQLRMSARRSTLGLQLKGYLLGPVMYVRSVLWARRSGLHEVLRAEPAAAKARDGDLAVARTHETAERPL